MTAAAIVKVAFHGDTVDCVRDDFGVWVSIARVCDALGLDRRAQQRRLADEDRSPWATGAVTALVAAADDGKARTMAFINLDALPMWLATIDATRVAPSSKAKIIAYQRECAKALRDYFFAGAALNPNGTPKPAKVPARR